MLSLAVASVLLVLLIPPPAAASDGAARWHTFTAANGLAGNIVQAIWEDPHGAIWFGTERGASRYDGRVWQTYRSGDGLIDDNVWSISGDAAAVWFATSNGLSRLANQRWTHFSTGDGLPNNDVRAVLAARDGSVWVGTFGGGIAWRTPGSARWEKLDLSAVIANRDVAVQAIWQAPDGALWFSTSAFGALRRAPDGTLERKKFTKGSRNTVWAVGGGQADGGVWAGTFRGAVAVAPDFTETPADVIVAGVPISETEILAVEADASTIWFGTRASGVLRLSGQTWTRYTTADGLSRDYVLAILADRAGRVWFGTRGGGVTLRDPIPIDVARLQAAVAARDIQHNTFVALEDPRLSFDQNNLQFTFSLPLAWRPAQDVAFRYWLRGSAIGERRGEVQGRQAPGIAADSLVNDFISLPPGRYELHVVPVVDDAAGSESIYPFTIGSAPPALTVDALNISVDGASLPRGVTLDPTLFGGERQVRLSFAATDDATAEQQIAYEYRVDDASAAWRRADGAYVTLALARGVHHVDVRAIDADGNLSEPATLTVIVPPPFWITVLIYLVVVAIPGALGGAAGAFLYRRWLRRQALLRAVRGHFIPYDVGPLIADPERYIGRAPILDTILGRIDNNSFYVYGEKRIGKTSLLVQIKQRLEQRNAVSAERRYIPVFLNIQDVPQEQFWLTLARGIGDATAGLAVSLQAHGAPPGYDDFDAQDDLEAIVEQLAAHGACRPVIVLLLDEVDTLQRYDPFVRQRFRAFCQHMQTSLRVVVVGVVPPHAEATETSPWYNIFVPIALEPLEMEDIRFLIRSYNQNPYGYTSAAEQALVDASDRKPFDAQWLCSEAVRAMLAAGRASVLLSDVERAIVVVVGERRREYRAFWNDLAPEIQNDVRAALDQDGPLTPERVARGDYDTLFVLGLAVRRPDGYRLAYLFRRWLREIKPMDDVVLSDVPVE